jgi:CPA2 family monovalent cation:H+ antiporter-2
VVVGPFTPGYVADVELAPQLAEIGVILLMFGVGLHFSPGDLMRVRKVALPGAVAQIAVATVLGWAVGRFLLGMGHLEAALLGFALSVASTVVLLRAVEGRGELKSEAGRLAVGWLVVEDIVMVLALVMLPLTVTAQAGPSPALFRELAWTVAAIAVFVGFMFIVGGRVLPWILVKIAHTRSRELFTLGVLSIALGIAFLAYEVFGASFALGAFVAGLVLNRDPLGRIAGERSLPFQDAFAVLFFVSVGMLFDPMVLVERPLAVAAVLAIVLVGKGVAALAITSVFRVGRRTSFIVAASLGQIGEFSFVLAAVGLSLKVMSRETHDLILAAALISIAANPLMFKLADMLAPAPNAKPMAEPEPSLEPNTRTSQQTVTAGAVAGVRQAGAAGAAAPDVDRAS